MRVMIVDDEEDEIEGADMTALSSLFLPQWRKMVICMLLVWAYDGALLHLSRHPLGSLGQAMGVGVVAPLMASARPFPRLTHSQSS